MLVGLLGLWAVWLTFARISIYATSATARLEVTRENQPVDAPVSGRVAVALPPAGRLVHAGDILLEFDAAPERLEQSRLLARVTPSSHQMQALRDEIAAQERAVQEEIGSAAAATAEAGARAREAQSRAEYAAEEATRLASLQRNGLVPELEALRAAKLADQRRSEAETSAFAASRLTSDLQASREDRLARIARLHSEIAAIEGTRSEALAGSDRLGYDISQRVVRAPMTGVLAETATVKPGSVVRAGDRLATIVPEGTLKTVAFFTHPARTARPGPPRRLSLDAVRCYQRLGHGGRWRSPRWQSPRRTGADAGLE